jgi:hypothetical protein
VTDTDSGSPPSEPLPSEPLPSEPLPTGLLDADGMAFRARALAQSEAFTSLARKVVDVAMEQERKAQPGNFSVWANAAFTKGYCVRCVEEADVGLALVAAPADALPDMDRVLEVTDKIVVGLRSDDTDLAEHLIADEARLFDVLDQVIGSEVRNRTDNAGPTLSSRARFELEDYLTYWVVKGYALRAAEQATGAVVPA